MKLLLLVISSSFLLLGCSEDLNIDKTPPPAPQGIKTISLDNAVEIQWLPSQADDVKGYNVWVSDQYDGSYQLIASTSSVNLVDYGAINGITYYYAVSAYDFNNNESQLSKDVIYDTPRPEGYGVYISDFASDPNLSGYDFSSFTKLEYNNMNTDFYFENSNERYYLNVWNNSDIQDMGYTSSLDEISFSPTEGWAPSKSAEAIVGHTYIIWTRDNHYAKVRVKNVSSNLLIFDWAYQTAVGNPELKIAKDQTQTIVVLKKANE